MSLEITKNSQHYSSSLHKEIEEFWQTGVFSSFKGIDDVKICFAQFISHPKGQCLVISPGRAESYIKYQELVFELNQHGYNVFIIDHRGQGFSQRMTQNPNKGYVQYFDDYAHDLASYIKQKVICHCVDNSQPLILAHSMGAAIAARVLQLYPDLIKAAVLSSPMFAINNHGIPLWLAKGVIKIGAALNHLCSKSPWYFLNHGDYQAVSFADNTLTHSKSRYQIFIDRYQQQPEVQLGGVTFQWLAQALQANRDIFGQINQIKTPVLVLQAGEDSIVDNKAQDDFCAQLNQRDKNLCDAEPFRINGAYHELFFEQNKIKQIALVTSLEWFGKL